MRCLDARQWAWCNAPYARRATPIVALKTLACAKMPIFWKHAFAEYRYFSSAFQQTESRRNRHFWRKISVVNRPIPILSVVLGHAETFGYRAIGDIVTPNSEIIIIYYYIT
jgi:hypothetical protein